MDYKLCENQTGGAAATQARNKTVIMVTRDISKQPVCHVLVDMHRLGVSVNPRKAKRDARSTKNDIGV